MPGGVLGSAEHHPATPGFVTLQFGVGVCVCVCVISYPFEALLEVREWGEAPSLPQDRRENAGYPHLSGPPPAGMQPRKYREHRPLHDSSLLLVFTGRAGALSVEGTGMRAGKGAPVSGCSQGGAQIGICNGVQNSGCLGNIREKKYMMSSPPPL